jgi:glycosyltransferase involved in cell wall biosynthesis
MIPGLRRVMLDKLSIASLVWLAAEEDLDMLDELPTAVAPNVPFSTGEHATSIPPSLCRDVLFVGNYEPNRDGVRWFVRHCWPGLHRLHPTSRFRVVGYGSWSELADEFQDVAGVDFVGGVADLAAEYARARLVISPLFSGGGTKVKVIEACAFGRPVVATALSGRGFGPEIAALLPQSDSADGFVRHCSRDLGDAAAADDLGSRLQVIQRKKFSRAAVETRIAEQLTAIMEDSGPARRPGRGRSRPEAPARG